MTIVTEVIPRSLELADTATEEGRAAIRERYAAPSDAYVRLNMIATLTGDASGGDGTSDSLTGGADRTILGIIRREADVVVIGAASVRAERYVVPKSARLAIVTRTGELGGHRLDPALAAERVLLIGPAGASSPVAASAAALGATFVPVPGDDDGILDPRLIIPALAERGLRRVVCEGGPGLATALSQTGMIDEYCITMAPALGDAGAPFIRAPLATRLTGMMVDESGFSYLRLRPAR